MTSLHPSVADPGNPNPMQDFSDQKSKAHPFKRGHIFVVVGASGDLAKKFIYPALWELYKKFKLPMNIHIVGFARTKLKNEDLRDRCKQYMKGHDGPKGREKLEKFWQAYHVYTVADYEDVDKCNSFDFELRRIEHQYEECDRTFYLAIPHEVHKPVTALIKDYWMATKGGRTNIAVEKPFGTDLLSSEDLEGHLALMFKETEILRIDHHLCHEMVEAILAVRFSNRLFISIWNSQNIAAVMITFKEKEGTLGRGGLYDKSGVIRDVMQNHMLQILSLIAMEKPESCSDGELKKEKAKVVRSIRRIKPEDVVLGQYVGNPDSLFHDPKIGYKDDKTVPDTSKTPTFATMVFFIDNERWAGVPFIMRCGKAVGELKEEVRVQFKPIHPRVTNLFSDEILERNELVVQLKPAEKISLRVTGKHPGVSMDLENTEIDLNYNTEFRQEVMTGHDERLLLSVLNRSGNSHFVGRKELKHSWELFSPILTQLESRQPLEYEYGSKGPKEADELCAKHNFYLSSAYPW